MSNGVEMQKIRQSGDSSYRGSRKRLSACSSSVDVLLGEDIGNAAMAIIQSLFFLYFL